MPNNYDEKTLLDCIEAPLPITNIYRCQKRKIVNGNKTKDWIPAKTIKVTFRGQQVPDEVNFGYSSRKVNPDVPRVLLCFKCMRFGHASKFCKQEKQTCRHCGYQHDVIQGTKCEKELRCFHCHSNEHDAGDKSCPEFIRNSLVKETMVFWNLTFSEANKESTESSFRLAEKSKEFPSLKGPKLNAKERPSFPKKTIQDLQKQYQDYLQLNSGSKSKDGESTAKQFS